MGYKLIALPEYDAPAVAPIRMSSRGLLGGDKIAFVKRAGEQAFHEFAKLAFAPGEVPIHMLAMGATESFGPNRNGDGFRRDVLRRDHPTFVKYARMYRGHKSDNPRNSYGRVAGSWFNDDMDRVELVVALNGTKEAAERNGGLVADTELAMLDRGDDMPVSMGTNIPYDVCSWCGNKAPKPDYYCTSKEAGGGCEAGGLKKNNGRIVTVAGNQHHLHADNPINRFYDISRVGRQADRIAFATGRFDMPTKTAAVDEIQYVLRPGPLRPLSGNSDVSRLMVAAQMLASHESSISDVASHAAALPGRTGSKLAAAPAVPAESLLDALIAADVSLPLPEFLQVFAGQSVTKSAELAAVLRPQLRYVYTQLAADESLPQKFAAAGLTLREPVLTDATRNWAASLRAEYGVSHPDTVKRAALATVRGISDVVDVPQLPLFALDDSPASRLVEHYALYKLALAGRHSADDLALTGHLLVLQNLAG